MNKLLLTLVLLLFVSTSFSQWTRVNQLPASDITALFHKENNIYAGGKNLVYISRNMGDSWDSTNIIPTQNPIANIIVYHDELYATAFGIGVFKSVNEGASWQNITAGIFPFVSDLCEFNKDLYAITLGGGAFKLEATNRNSWIAFNSGLSNQSMNLTSIAGNSQALVAGTLGNGMYDHLPLNAVTWEERFLRGQISPSEGVYDIVTAHDSLFTAGHTGKFYLSTDNGLTWDIFGSNISSSNNSLANAKQALILARSFFNGINNTSFLFVKKDALAASFIPFSLIADHFNYKIDIVGKKLWDASNKGLFFMSLSDLPGITAVDEPGDPLPVHFSSFHADCKDNKVLLSWKTAQEQNSSQYNIEESTDALHWTSIGNKTAAGNSTHENNYLFAVDKPISNAFYRIAANDRDGSILYSNVIHSSCTAAVSLSTWPNPVHDILYINVDAGNESQVSIKLFDSKGSLVKVVNPTVLPGSNILTIDMRSLSAGVYTLVVDRIKGDVKKVVQVVKQ